MKILFILVLFISHAQASDFQIKLDSKGEALNKVLSSVWKSIPYEYEWNKKVLARFNDGITTHLVSGKINLGLPGTPLARAMVKQENTINLNWNLTSLTSDLLIKVRFKFRQLGVEVTHDEYFEIKAKNIKKAQSDISFEFNEIFQINSVEHKEFAFDWIEVKPRDGIGSVLRFIFDNVWSKEEVDRFLKNEINKELQSWINKNDLIENIQAALNSQLQQREENPIRLSEIASDIYPTLTQFKVDQSNLSLAVDFNIDTSDYKVHECAQELITKNDASIESGIVEKLLSNMATFEVEEDNIIKEPLFCFGYKDYDENGNPLGEKAKVSALGRDIRFHYWVTPIRTPQYSYDFENNEVSIDLEIRIRLQSKGFPRIKVVNNFLTARVIGTFKLNLNEGEGLQLVFKNFLIPQLNGKIKVRWFRLMPYIGISTNRVRGELEKSINQLTNNNNSIVHLIDENLTINENIDVKIKDFNLNNQGYQFQFELK